MSKNLIKILSICIAVVVFPLVIFGAIVLTTQAVGVKLTVAAAGIEGGHGTSSKVAIYIDGEEQEKDTITIKKNTEVTITYEGVGYDFQGWYKGNYAEIKTDTDEKFATTESYTFIVRDSVVLTAVRNVKTYTITYAGKMDNGTTDISVNPNPQTLVYGDSLADIAASQDGRSLIGWYVAEGDTNDVATTKVANFEKSGAYTLNPVWSDQMLISYYKGDTFIASELVSKDVIEAGYSLKNATNVASSIDVGYEFAGWMIEGGTDSAVNSINEYRAAGYKLQLKQTPINYTVTVKYHAKSDATNNVTYDVANGYTDYNVTRTGYTLQGFKYGDNLYTYDNTQGDYVDGENKLSSLIISKNVLSVTAVWKCDYDGVYFMFSGVYGYRSSNNALTIDPEATIKAKNDDVVVGPGHGSTLDFLDWVSFNDSDEGYDLTDDIYEKFVEKTPGNSFTVSSEDSSNGKTVSWKGNIQISLTNLGTSVGSVINYTATSGTFTFATLMNLVKNQGEYTNIYINFVFEETVNS